MPRFASKSYQINPTSPRDSQDSPAVAAMDDGRVVTVYRSHAGEKGMLRYVIHNADGSVASDEAIVEPGNKGFVDSGMVNIAALDGGGFAVTWTQRDGDQKVFHRVFDAEGKPVTKPIMTTKGLLDGHAVRHSDIASDGKGGFYLVWDDHGLDTDPGPQTTYQRAVFYQHFDGKGKSKTKPKMLSDEWGADWDAAIAVSRDGKKINIVWDDDLGRPDAGTSSDGIYGFEIGGKGVYRVDGGVFQEFHTDPDVAYSSGNTFMAVWSEYLGNGRYAVHGAVNGGPEFRVNTSDHEHWYTVPKVVGLESGEFLVVWADGGHKGNADVLGQFFDASGNRVGKEFKISDRVSKHISRIEVSETSDGRIVVTWDSANGPTEIYGRVIDPRDGAVEWKGGAASEQFVGTQWADKLRGGGGDDRISGGSGDDTISGDGGNDTLVGDGGNDTLNGGDGDDVLVGGAGGDQLIGGKGRDTASYVGSAQKVVASLAKPAGNQGDAAGDGYVSIENLTGSAKGDVLTGNKAGNVLAGEGGHDVLDGGGGNDRLVGGAGADTLKGGKGADTFVFLDVTDSGTAKGKRDVITDFKQSQGDRIDLSAIDARSGTAKNEAFVFLGEKQFSGKKGELRFETKKGTTYVYGDVDGDRKADFALQLAGEIDLKKADFLL
jgi:Ca2+-binding RTX toxin-like protein